MNLLLDTHVLIWVLENNPTLSPEAREAIIDGRNPVFVSAASVWEIEIKKNLGRLECPDNLAEELARHRFTPLPISLEHAEKAGRLPPLHNDPFDRMLIAQALCDRLILVTRDRQIADYEVEILPA